jgi:hypothetical protein
MGLLSSTDPSCSINKPSRMCVFIGPCRQYARPHSNPRVFKVQLDDCSQSRALRTSKHCYPATSMGSRMFTERSLVLQWVTGVVGQGQGIASGRNPVEGDVRGTIRAQREFFRRAGIDTDRLYDGTINVDISPLRFEPIRPSLILRDVRWHPIWAPETFSLFACKVVVRELEHDGFVYYPHPETKPGIFPGHHIAEVWCPFIDGVTYGDAVKLGIFTDAFRIRTGEPPKR